MIARLRRSKKGFTLVELLVVIVVLAVLGAIVVPKFIGAGKESRESALRSDLQLLRNAIQLCYSDTGLFPAQLNDLAETNAPAQGVDRDGNTQSIVARDWKGPYVVAVPNDAVSGEPLKYGATDGLAAGEIRSSATGNATQDGTAYSTW